MPTYEYACKACGEHLEVVQSFKDSALTECPACGGPLRKVFGNIGVAFKGSGFYKTDSRSEHKSGASKPSDGAAATKSEGTKPESTKSEGAKAEPKSEGTKSQGSSANGTASGPSNSSGGASKVSAAS
jgi:putative FmdB family regulatory protein